MNANCLVKKLKGVVDADLKKLGVITIKSRNASPVARRVVPIYGTQDQEITLKITSGDANFTNSDGSANYGDTFENPRIGTSTAAYVTGDCTIDVLNKYNTYWIDLSNNALEGFDLSDYTYCKNVWIIEGYGDLSTLKGSTGIKMLLIASGSNTYGDIAYLSENTGMTRIRVNRPDVYGDVKSLGKMTQLAMNNSTATAGATVFDFRGTKITGYISELCNQMYANGRHSGYFIYAPNDLVHDPEGATAYDILYRIVQFTNEGWTAL